MWKERDWFLQLKSGREKSFWNKEFVDKGWKKHSVSTRIIFMICTCVGEFVIPLTTNIRGLRRKKSHIKMKFIESSIKVLMTRPPGARLWRRWYQTHAHSVTHSVTHTHTHTHTHFPASQSPAPATLYWYRLYKHYIYCRVIKERDKYRRQPSQIPITRHQEAPPCCLTCVLPLLMRWQRPQCLAKCRVNRPPGN